MLDAWIANINERSVNGRKIQAGIIEILWLLGVIGLAGLLSLFMYLRGPQPNLVAWFILGCGAALIFIRPRYGLYICIFATLIGDGSLVPWYPFVKNMSSSESIFYIHNAVILTPLEVCLALTYISWLGRGAMRRKITFFASPMLWPALLFSLFLVVGLVWGLSKGGNLTIALWESRPIFYILLMIILVTNLIETPKQLQNLFWAAMLGIGVEGIIGTHIVLVQLRGDLSTVPDLTEHAAAIPMNSFFIFVASAWLFMTSWPKRLLLPMLAPLVLITYIASQRRAAFLTLFIALFLMAFILYKENKWVFWGIMPVIGIVALVYIGIFWNSSGALGLPAQAIKSVIAEDQSNAADQSSNAYRILENMNIAFTIHVSPLLGVGFGQKFYVVYPMPDISFFEWWEYFPHNSILWIWLKTGVGGFVSMLFLLATAITMGVRAIWRLENNELKAMVTTATLLVIMHFMFAYVDIGWDMSSMLYVGMMMGVIGVVEHLAIKDYPVEPKRWPWLLNPKPVPKLRPLPFED